MKSEERDKLVDAAARKSQDAVEKFPESPAVNLSAARVMIAAGRFEQARDYADRASKLAPEDPWPVVNRGIAEFESCDFPAARQSAVQALRRDGRNQNAKAIWALSQRPAGCNDIKDKLQSLYVGGKLLELSTPGRIPSLEAFGDGGTGFDAGGPPAQAASAEAVGAASGNRYTREGFQRFERLMNAAGGALKGGLNEQAYDLATAAILAYPENPNALNIRGIAAMNLKRLDTVVADATWGAKLDDKHKAHWLAMRSAAEEVSGRLSVALSDAQSAVKADPGEGGAWLALASTQEDLKYPPEQWLPAYRRAAELSPAFAARYADALARAQSGRNEPPEDKRPGAVVSQNAAAWALGGVAAGGLLLAFGAAFLFGRSRRDGDES
jgi:tetratricopeptide (TPR) repeat protein